MVPFDFVGKTVVLYGKQKEFYLENYQALNEFAFVKGTNDSAVSFAEEPNGDVYDFNKNLQNS